MKKKYIPFSFALSLGLLVLPNCLNAKVVHLMPKAQSYTLGTGTFDLVRPIKVESTNTQDISQISSFIIAQGGTVSADASPVIKVTYVTSIDGATVAPEEAYTLNITADAVNITAINSLGVIRAVQTLQQLALGWDGTPKLEQLTMTDYPNFKIRGLMHDIGRSYMEVDELKKEIDLLSKFKINIFHWHLTENQGWRLESKIYPQLNANNAYTRHPGKYYTHEQVKDIMAYCAERGVTIIPEIDMPGHSGAYERAMGHVMQSTQGLVEMKALLKEACELFTTSPYIHIGGDETAINDFREDGKNFLQIMVTYAKETLGKKVMCWNSAARGFDVANSGVDIVTSWGGNTGLISNQQMGNVDCRFYYLNHTDVYADLIGMYKSNIYNATKGDVRNSGALASIWNDRKLASDHDIVASNNLYAAVLAIGERAWLGGGKQYITTGGTVLRSTSSDEYKEFANWEERFLFHKEHELNGEPIPYCKQSNIRWEITDAFPNGGNTATVFPPETEGPQDSYTYNGRTYSVGTAIGGAVYLKHTWGTMVPSFYASPADNSTAYAYTYVYSPKEQTVGAQISFQDYSRSVDDKVPDAGSWDRRGSKIWLNDVLIPAPTWTNAGKSVGLENNMGNENFALREPTKVTLKAGWNKVMIKTPSNSNGVSKPKWMFTFVLTNTEGTKELTDVVYSPNKCLNESAENVATALKTAKAAINASIKNEVGYYDATLATDLQAAIDEIGPTVSQEVTDDVRQQQIVKLESAISEFNKQVADAKFIQPKASTEASISYYRFFTPGRNMAYVTSNGENKAITGVTNNNTAEAAQWSFELRSDGSYNVKNRADNTYISPESTLKTVTNVPSAGWTLKKSNTLGLVIITSGTNQFNQSNNNNNVLNWGSGNTTGDAGCNYQFQFVETIINGSAALKELQSKLNEATAMLNTLVAKDDMGFYSPTQRAALNKLVNDITATLTDNTLTDEKRLAQIEEVQNAMTSYSSSINSNPKASNNKQQYWYTLCATQRGNRYVTSKGNGQKIIGETTSTEDSKWSFVKKADGTYNIVNKESLLYINPDIANNQALTTVTEEPQAGWQVKPAQTAGQYIIVSGTSQFNQTNNAGQEFAVFNWGSGTNTSDTGCQYSFVLTDSTSTITVGVDELADTSLPFTLENGKIKLLDANARIYGADGRSANQSYRKGLYFIVAEGKTYKVILK